MSADETDHEMTDLSQAPTEGPNSQMDSQFTSQSSGQIDENSEPWGRIVISRASRKRLGVRVVTDFIMSDKLHILDLVKEKTTFGKKGDCNISNFIVDQIKIPGISNIHFSIVKNDVQDPLCPIFVEDSSTNGTYVRQRIGDTNEKKYSAIERIDEKIKRRIIAHHDQIFVEKSPSICFEFLSYSYAPSNELPDDIIAEYHIGKELGSGACGVVNFVQNRRTCQFYALKLTRSDNEKSIDTMMKEVNILKRLDHPCILKLYKVQTYADSVAILIDYMKGGDLFGRLKNCGHFSESLTKFVFYQICSGVAYLHDKNVTHRDLKPENILLATEDKYTLVKVADFGLSKCPTTNSELKTQCGTVKYLAPEVRIGPYTNKVDIWSMGVILYNCFTGRYPETRDAHGNYDINHREKQWNLISKDAINIIRETMRVKPVERPSAKELLHQRSWMAKTDQMVHQALQIISQTNKV